MTNLLSLTLLAGLATYSVSRALAREIGPFGAFRGFRRWVCRARGYSPDEDGWWTRQRPTIVPGVAEREGLEADWIAAGATCPICMARYVGPALVAVALWAPHGKVVVAMLAAGGASVVLSARKSG